MATSFLLLYLVLACFTVVQFLGLAVRPTASDGGSSILAQEGKDASRRFHILVTQRQIVEVGESRKAEGKVP